jgi:hypothetical protein
MTESNNDNDRKKFPNLSQKDGVSNYGSWAVKAKSHLITLELWEVVGGNDTTAPPIPEPKAPKIIWGYNANHELVEIHVPGNQPQFKAATAAAAPWTKKSNKALDLIINAVADDLLYLVKRATTASQAWNSLHSALQPSNSVRAQAIKQRLMSYVCEPTFNVVSWLNDCQKQYDDLCNMDPENMDDIEFACLILNNMPVSVEWHSFLSGIRQDYSNRAMHPGSIEVISAIREEFWAKHKDNPETYQKVFVAKFQAETNKRRQVGTGNETLSFKRQQRGGIQRQDRPQRICTVKDCEMLIRHLAHDCFSYGGGKEGQYAAWYRGPKDIHLPKEQQAPRRSRPRTFHMVVENEEKSWQNSTQIAFAPPEIDGTRSSLTSPSVNATDARVNHLLAKPHVWLTHLPAGTLENPMEEKIVCAIPITNAPPEDSDDCYHNSTSNQHVFNHCEVFEAYRDISPTVVHRFSEGFKMAALGVGDVIVEGDYNGAKSTYKIRGCLYVPGSRANLISQVRLDKVGVSAWFENGKITLYQNGVLCIGGGLKNDMYRLNMRPILADQATITSDDELLIMAAKTGPGFYTA